MKHPALIALAALTAASVSAAPPPTVTTCDSCADCSQKLESGAWDVVELSVDLTDQGGICIGVDSVDGAELDCLGHIVDGDDIAIDPDFGIGFLHCTNVTVKNCRVSGFSYGIFLADTTSASVESCDSSDNGIGALLNYATSVEMTDNVFDRNYTGVELTGTSSPVTLTRNRACANTIEDINFVSGTGNTGVCNTNDTGGTWDGTPSGLPISNYPCDHIFSNGFEFQIECWSWSSVVGGII